MDYVDLNPVNTTLAGHTYLGVYGQDVKSASGMGLYTLESSTFNPEGFLIYSFSDGAFVGFNPNAINCSVGTGKILTTEMLSESLADCIGFIDVNGSTTPNREVRCKKEEATALSATASCEVTKGTMGDIFPIVFHDGAVELATNAGRGILGNGGHSLTPEELEAQRIARRRQFDKREITPLERGLTKAECEAFPSPREREQL